MQEHASPFFRPIALGHAFTHRISQLNDEDCSIQVVRNKEHLLTGRQVLRGIPFELGEADSGNNMILVKDQPVAIPLDPPLTEPYLVFLHAADFKESRAEPDGIFCPMTGNPRLGEETALYVLHYADGAEHAVSIRRRFQINEFRTAWGENSFECVPHTKTESRRHTASERAANGEKHNGMWGKSLMRHTTPKAVMRHWLYALENPFPDKAMIGITLVPRDGTVFLFGLTSGRLSSNPLRWEERKRKLVSMPRETITPDALCPEIGIDMGVTLSARPALRYVNWEESHANEPPAQSPGSWILEYSAHPQARMYAGREQADIQASETSMEPCSISSLESANRRIKLVVVDPTDGSKTAAKVHIHGEHGEYFAPMNRHRIPNPYWFEDYSTDYVHQGHCSTYIDGEAEYKLPLGRVYVEVTKGCEYRPVRCTFDVTEATRVIRIELTHALPWRKMGWVTADTHVHFLSPQTALLEGAAEGVHVVNLLAAQWGELFTNVGDYDGRTTFGSRENGGSGEYLVRVGTENRQHILGHLSLLGYEGSMILPLSTGGPGESALGDPVEATLSEWAGQCREQHGISILPHLPNPRAEGAAAIVLGRIDAVELCSYGDRYAGISLYALSDWYRYLNCGYPVPAVGGTDKMSAETAIGTIRTYSLIKNEPFTYSSWMDAVRQGRTFVTYGPLLDFRVNGCRMGERLDVPPDAVLDVEWEAATATIPVTKVELVVNGRLYDVKTVNPDEGRFAGSWSVPARDCGWIALRVRGRYPDKQEMIAAHSSPVMIHIDGMSWFNAGDAASILTQIEGASAYVQTIGTRAEAQVYERIKLTLSEAHAALKSRMAKL